MVIPVASAIQQQRERTGNVSLTFPQDIGAHGILMAFRTYDLNAIRSASNRTAAASITPTLTGTIVLPLPNAMQDGAQVKLSRFDQMFTGELVAQAAERVQSAAAGPNSASNAVSELRGVLSSVVPPGSEIAKILKGVVGHDVSNQDVSNVSFLLRKTIDNTGFGKAVDSGLGTTINPKAALAFEGVEIKLHTLDWNLMPRSETESKIIREIVSTIKRNMLPSYINVGVGDRAIQKAMFRYPSMVDITFLGVDAGYYYNFKTCMVQSVNIDYNPQGNNAILKGGKPASIHLRVELMETDIWSSEDYGGTSTEQVIPPAAGSDKEGLQ